MSLLNLAALSSLAIDGNSIIGLVENHSIATHLFWNVSIS